MKLFATVIDTIVIIICCPSILADFWIGGNLILSIVACAFKT
jgi:hypothetical protein